jgi:hypothetical protein
VPYRYDDSDIPYSCPYLDDAIKGIESARDVHNRLREWGNKQYKRAEAAEERVGELEDEIAELEMALKEARSQTWSSMNDADRDEAIRKAAGG